MASAFGNGQTHRLKPFLADFLEVRQPMRYDAVLRFRPWTIPTYERKFAWFFPFTRTRTLDLAPESNPTGRFDCRLFGRIAVIELFALTFGLTAHGEPLELPGLGGAADALSAQDEAASSERTAIPPGVRRRLLAEHHPQRLLVRFRAGREEEKRQAVHQSARARRVTRSFRYVNGLQLVEVSAADLAYSLAAYEKSPDVLYAEPDYIVHINSVPNDPQFGYLWGLHNIGQTVSGDPGTAGADIRALEAWEVWTGDPDFRIAVIDTGVDYTHPDLAGNIWTNPGEVPDNGIDDDGNGWIDDVHGYDFINNDSDPMDDHSHGTHVSGTIGAVANNDTGVVGINWYCKIVGLKFLDEGGTGYTSGAVAALGYALANNIQVSNNSWGGGGYSQALYDAIEATQAVGHIFVAAAGNDYRRNNDVNPHYPSSYDLPNLIAVAATDNDDHLTSFSNIGPTSVDLGAPGETILSTVRNGGYQYYSGTSMATPHVAGVVALLMSRSPQLGWPDVRQRVIDTVRPVDSLIGVTATGGVVNAFAALGDCNSNGVPDDQDIAAGTSEDCTGNGIPDECELDCNGNGSPDSCDIAAAISMDCNGNNIPDECEPDCNGNDVADSCDVLSGTSLDCNFNVIPDECELITDGDCNANGIPDDCDASTPSDDCDGNGVPDECDPDCNQNGMADVCELANGTARDCNYNGVPDDCDIEQWASVDCSGNSIPDECEPDCNGNGIADSCETAEGLAADCNDNEVPDECEPDEDCNGNGIRDICDIGAGTSGDCNQNLVPDACDIAVADSPDCNGNGIPDECEGQADCNGNAIQDICDVASGTSEDCDANGVPDECQSDCNANMVADACDVTDGTSVDANGNGVPDECEFVVYVDAAAPGANNGNSWVSAYTDLQDALADTRATQIWVAAGVYRPTGPSGDRMATFALRSGLALYGGFAGSETTLDERNFVANETILSGDLNADDQSDGPTSDGPATDCCTWHDDPGCSIDACEQLVCARRPSCCSDFWSGTCANIARNDLCCELCAEDNYCDNSLHVVTANGTDASARLDGFTIRDGRANRQYTSDNAGGAMVIAGASPTIANCRFVNNSCIYLGGAIENTENSNTTLVNCMFSENKSMGGGAMFIYDSDPTMVNCVFTGNKADSFGGALFSWTPSSATLINCTLYANTAGNGGGIFDPDMWTLTNCILWGNSDEDNIGEDEQIAYGTAVINYSCIQGWTGIRGGIGNFGSAPGFLDAAGPDGITGTIDDNLRLASGSPCVDAGNNVALPAGVDADAEGNARFIDDPGARDTGFGTPPMVDLGAYERTKDCNGNGISDSADIENGFSSDCNGNGVPDECDPDCNANGIADECEPDQDCNNNQTQDICDIAAGISPDCNGNSVPDGCDLASGGSLDENSDGFPDECEPQLPSPAPFPHERRKNRYISFDPNNLENGHENVAFKIELKSITLGSCDGNGGPCRADRGSEDCRRCSIDGNPCINAFIDCAPAPPQTCIPTGQVCVNDAPDAGGTSVGHVWWVGPESPMGNGVHLMVSEAFRKESTDWPNPVHVGDCEIVPQAVYGVRAVNVDIGMQSDEVEIETTLYAPISSSWWADAVGPLRKFCGGDIHGPQCSADGDCAPPQSCDPAWTLPDGAVNFDDISAALALVAPAPASVAPHMTWIDLHGNATGTPASQNFDPPNYVANFSDVGQIIFGFQGLPYKGYDPVDCPDTPAWP